MNIWLGYAPDKNASLIAEIQFACAHFDFLDLTLPPEGLIDREFEQARDCVEGFSLVGHLPAHLDFFRWGDAHLLQAKKHIAQLAILGASTICVWVPGSSSSHIIQKISQEIDYLHTFAQDHFGIDLFVENSNCSIGSDLLSFANDYLAAFPHFSLCLHQALFSPPLEQSFLNTLKDAAHINLHFVLESLKYSYFPASSICHETLSHIVTAGYEGRITLNMFSSASWIETHHEKMLQQLEWRREVL